jgi:excisionase family DNA binding protein
MSSNIRITRVCQFCGGSFTAKTTVTKYCGDNCSKRAYKLRMKEEKIQQSNTETATTLNQAWVNASQKDYLNVKETCVFMGISRTTLWRLVSKDSLSAKSIGRKRIFRKSELETFLNQ